MIQIDDTHHKTYHWQGDGDPLHLEKGNCHFNHQGQKDFLSRITAYGPSPSGCAFEVLTFRGRTAGVDLTFCGETSFRFRMYPRSKPPRHLNEVFSFPGYSGTETVQEDEFVVVRTKRLTLRFRKSPWEMRVELDGRELTLEQIKDHNVDQKYKAVPTGFTMDGNGDITDEMCIRDRDTSVECLQTVLKF